MSKKYIRPDIDTYILALDGTPLHYYGQGVYGWGQYSSTTGKPGVLVEWDLMAEVEDWMKKNKVFCQNARVQFKRDVFNTKSN